MVAVVITMLRIEHDPGGKQRQPARGFAQQTQRHRDSLRNMDIRQHDDQGDHRRPDHGLFNGVHHPCAKGNMLALIAGGDRHQYHHQRQLEDVLRDAGHGDQRRADGAK